MRKRETERRPSSTGSRQTVFILRRYALFDAAAKSKQLLLTSPTYLTCTTLRPHLMQLRPLHFCSFGSEFFN